jgi:hypothetical protein
MVRIWRSVGSGVAVLDAAIWVSLQRSVHLGAVVTGGARGAVRAKVVLVFDPAGRADRVRRK